MKKWVIIDEKNGDMFEEILEAKTKEEAVAAARREYDRLSSYDKKQRTAFYVGFAEIDEDEIIDFDTMTDIVEVKA